jgi:aminoglycoside phosphotransferase family enzyme/predicted kinase
MSAAMMSDDAQSDVFALLGNPDTYGGGEVKRIDTHAAAVFLTETRAYKVKRAVRFPFLDYSTSEKRKAACEAELAVNQAFAPQLYRRVVPITREPDGRLALDGAGVPIEWALEMQRFDETATFDRLAARHELDLAIANELARVVAAFHAKAPLANAEPWIKRLADYVEQNREELGAYPELFGPREVEALSQASDAALRQHDSLLRRRGRAGLVRRGHGDLHLGNIVLIGGKPVAFDAIEFDPLMATGDLLYDLAFVLMDLIDRGSDCAANVVLNRYLAETHRIEDLDGLAALPLFLSLRAAIRAKVTAAKRDVDGADRRAATQAAQGYFRLAARLVTPPPPVLVAVGGLSGSGKSALARALAPSLPPPPGAVVLRSDVERKAMFGVAETERLPAAAYSEDAAKRVYAALADKARRVIGAGHTAIVDAVFARADERAQIAAVAQTSHVPFRGLFLTADLEIRIARVTARMHDASDANATVARQQESYALGAMAWTEIDASGDLGQTLRAAQDAIASHASGSPILR